MTQAQNTFHCIVVGSGFSGICMGIKLRDAGFDDFLILEKADEVGGTWRDNHYPGAECDVPSALYSYSFERKTDWNYQWSEQSQILEYIRHVVAKHNLASRIRFGADLVSARFDEQQNNWSLSLACGETLTARYLISAVGQLHKPNIPSIQGQNTYQGATFHSAQWNHDIDLSGKSVAVIGNAASAVQFVPPVAQQAGRLAIFQRSPNWLAEKRDKPYSDREKAMMRRFPFIKSLSRLKIYLRNELIVLPAIRGNRLTSWLLRTACLSYLNRTIKDESVRRLLTPDYPIGAKRILTAKGYYETLNRDNVELVTDSITSMDKNGLITADGLHRDFDVIIYGTGFVTNPFLEGIDIIGRGNRHLSEHWSKNAHAYLGVATHHFPNLFFLYGPNTNLGHNSILLMSEAQANYIVQVMQAAHNEGRASMEVREDVEARYNLDIQARLRKTAWNTIGDSWYKSGGLITNNWPGSVGQYRRRMRKFTASDFAG